MVGIVSLGDLAAHADARWRQSRPRPPTEHGRWRGDRARTAAATRNDDGCAPAPPQSNPAASNQDLANEDGGAERGVWVRLSAD